MKKLFLLPLFLGSTALSSCVDDAAVKKREITQAALEQNDRAVNFAAAANLETVNSGQISVDLSDRFSALALNCIQKEFPNKISRTTHTAEEIGAPKEIFPVFYGCFDWHSAVHGHWLLIRLLRLAPEADWKNEAMAKLDENFSESNIAGEIANFARPARGSWERPYGVAWFLQLTSELREWDDPQAKVWLTRLEPLENDIADSLKAWLPKLAYPIRLGTHNQSAFAFGLMWDWAEMSGDTEMLTLLKEKSLIFHENDIDCPLSYEPSGEDFLSPCLMEADLMRRILPPEDFVNWLSLFMPNIPKNGSADWLEPGIVKDASDGKLVHLDGVNLSRAWNLYNIAAALPEDDARRASLIASAVLHENVGIDAVSDEHYSGSHWLASFATYLKTARGRT